MNKRIIYYNIIDNSYYDSNGILFGNRDFFTYLENKDTIELHYVTDVTGNDPTAWTKWTGLSTLPTIASSVAVDDSIQHAFKGVLLNELSGTVTSIQVQVTETVYLNPQGILQVFDSLGTAKSFTYSALSIADTILTFTVNETLGAGVTYPVNSEVRLSEALCIKATENDVDNTYASQGVFTFTLYALSYKILELLDYTDTEQIEGILEHKILSNGNTIYTYSIPYIIRNLRDFGNEAQVPNQEADSIASKTWVLSIIGSRPPIPSGGSVNQVLAKASNNDYEFEWQTFAIPSATSQLTNDSGFITSEDIPSANSQLINDSDFVIVGNVHNIPSGGSAGQVLAKVSSADYATNWVDVSGGSFSQVNSDWEAISGVAEILNKPDIPSATSYLTNDSGYITAEDIPTIPSAVSQLTNDTGFITASSIPSATSQLTNDSDFVTSADIPSATSQLINDSDFLSVGQIYGIPSGGSTGQVLSKVNTTDYNVAWTTPATGGSVAQVQSDWNQTNNAEVDFIKNKPDLSEFTTTGYVDSVVSGKADIEDLANYQLVSGMSVYALTENVHNIPTGGVTGQLLTKKSNTDYDSEWGLTTGVSGNQIPVRSANYTLNADTVSEITSGAGVTVDNLKIKDGRIDFNTEYVHDGNEPVGSLYYDSEYKTLSAVLPEEVVLQIGQELFFNIDNKTGSIIPNGTAISYGGSMGNSGRLKGIPALADGNTPAVYVLGIATQDIPIDGSGMVTRFGVVRGIDTTGASVSEEWVAGDILYVHPTIAGALTKVIPDAPKPAINMAAIVSVHATNGCLFVRPTFPEKLAELSDVDGIPHDTDGQILVYNAVSGFWNASHNINNYLTEVNSNRWHGVTTRPVGATNPLPTTINSTTFTLGATANPISYYYNGTLVNVIEDKTAIVSGAAGLHYVYFDGATGNIISDGFPGFGTSANVFLASVLWNGTDYGLVQDERHSHTRNLAWHGWAHLTVGCRYRSGLSLSVTGTGATATLAYEVGEIADEDIYFHIPSGTTCRLLWQTSETNYSFDKTPSTVPFQRGANNRPCYVKSTGLELTEMSSAPNRYINVFVFATTDLSTPIYMVTETVSDAIADSNGHTSLTDARTVPFPNLSNFGLSPEMRPIYRLLIRADGVVQDITSADDYRTVSSLPMAAGTRSTTATAVSFAAVGNISSTNVQSAIEELDSEKVAIVAGKALSTNDFTNDYKSKLDGIASGAEANVNANWDAVSGDAQILNKPTLGTASTKDIPASGDASSAQVVYGTDSRLTNARTPSAHTHSGTDITGLTASRVLTSGSDGKLAVSTVTTTTLSYLDATSSIQTQLNTKSASSDVHSIPSGGTTGQSLVKSSNTSYAVEWATVSGSSSSGGSMEGYPETTDFTDADSGKLATAYVSQGIDAYTKLYLKLDNNVTDSSPNGLTATATDITYTTDPKKMAFNYGAVFNGTSSKISITDSIIFGNIWHLDWFGVINNLTDLHYIYSQAKSDNTDLALDIYISGGKVGVLYSTDGANWANLADHVGTTILAPNVRYFFSLESDGTNISFYINGILEKQWSNSSALHNSAEPLWIGQCHYNNGAFKLAGVIDEFRITVGTTRAVTIPSFQYATAGTKSIVLSTSTKDNADTSISNLVTAGLNRVANLAMPDTSSGTAKTANTRYTASSNGWLYGLSGGATAGHVYVYIGATTDYYYVQSSPAGGYGLICPVKAGLEYKFAASMTACKFYPCIGG